MELINWGYKRWNRIRAVFDTHPSSPVIFGKIHQFYIVNRIIWNDSDPVVSQKDLRKMEVLLNEELGCLPEYLNRKSTKGEVDI